MRRARVTLIIDEMRLTRRPWRVGRKVGRTIYAVVGDEPDDADVLIGMMDNRRLARAAVDAHNEMLDLHGLGPLAKGKADS